MDGAVEEGRLAVGADTDLALIVNDAHTAIGPRKSDIQVVWFGRRYGIVAGLPRRRAVMGVNASQERVNNLA